jgi:hypothetical protein
MRSPFRRLQRSQLLISIGIGIAAAAATLGAQGVVADIVRVSFVQTTSPVSGGPETLVEQGTISIAPDGRYRIDRQKNGVASAEIVDVTMHRRVILDLQKHTALSGTMLMAPIVPGPGPRPTEQSLPHSAEELDRSEVSLGTRVVGGLVLEGTRQTVTSQRASGSLVVNTAEMWIYRFAGPEFVLVELRLTSEDSVDPRRPVDEQRIVNVSRVRGSDELFKIPAGFSVVDSLR